jgi:hypothetical protein
MNASLSYHSKLCHYHIISYHIISYHSKEGLYSWKPLASQRASRLMLCTASFLPSACSSFTCAASNRSPRRHTVCSRSKKSSLLSSLTFTCSPSACSHDSEDRGSGKRVPLLSTTSPCAAWPSFAKHGLLLQAAK